MIEPGVVSEAVTEADEWLTTEEREWTTTKGKTAAQNIAATAKALQAAPPS